MMLTVCWEVLWGKSALSGSSRTMAREAVAAVTVRLKSVWIRSASWTEARARRKAGRRSHLRRMAGAGQSSGQGARGDWRRPRKKADWELVVPGILGINVSCE